MVKEKNLALTAQNHWGMRGNTKTTGGPLPYLSGGAPHRAGRTGYRVRAGARGSRPRLGKGLLFCVAQAFKREACSQSNASFAPTGPAVIRRHAAGPPVTQTRGASSGYDGSDQTSGGVNGEASATKSYETYQASVFRPQILSVRSGSWINCKSRCQVGTPSRLGPPQPDEMSCRETVRTKRVKTHRELLRLIPSVETTMERSWRSVCVLTPASSDGVMKLTQQTEKRVSSQFSCRVLIDTTSAQRGPDKNGEELVPHGWPFSTSWAPTVVNHWNNVHQGAGPPSLAP
ncbi:hypothetical protein GOODEAATRI_009530 [Goodea atripinnis]|uniref:Uncharacterized protein n=1 Tax=Goodea atripinnis TaxID=208336 RepID=A0ABV0MZY7_9TELE